MIHKRVYPREAAATRKRANDRRAGSIPDLAGLGTVTSLEVSDSETEAFSKLP